MKMSLAVQVFKQADTLKESFENEKNSNPENWPERQKIQDLYQRLLLMDLEYALDKKVESDLWNVAFKNIIDAHHSKAAKGNAMKRAEQQASLSLFLEAASGFYFQFMHDVCCAFSLDLPFRRKSSRFGILHEPSPAAFEIKPPRKSSCFYLLQHILVHLGDIARYKKSSKQAETFYKHAAELIPTNGQPYNQLALLDMQKGYKLATVYHYIRAVGVDHPFPAAATNLEKFYEKLSKELIPSLRQKSSVDNFILTFLIFNSLLHLRENFSKAKECFAFLSTMICTNGMLSKMSPEDLHFMTCVSAFTLHRADDHDDSRKDGDDDADYDSGRGEKLSGDESVVYDLSLDFLVTLVSDLILEVTMKKDSPKHHKFLAVIKLVLALISQSRMIFEGFWVKEKSQFWPHLAFLLNSLQRDSTLQNCSEANWAKYKIYPMPEDRALQGFLPLRKYMKNFDFPTWRKKLTQSDGSEVITVEEHPTVRALHVLQIGKRIAENLGNLRLLSLEETKSGKMHFDSGIQMTDDHRFTDRSQDSRPPLRNQALGPRFANRANRQNVALQAFMSNPSRQDSIPLPSHPLHPPTNYPPLAKPTLPPFDPSRSEMPPVPPSHIPTPSSGPHSQIPAVLSQIPRPTNVQIPPTPTNLSHPLPAQIPPHLRYPPPPSVHHREFPNSPDSVLTAQRPDQRLESLNLNAPSFFPGGFPATIPSQPEASYRSQSEQRSSPSPRTEQANLPQDTRGQKNNQLYQAGKKQKEENHEDFPTLQSIAKTTKQAPMGSSFFTTSSSCSLSSSLSSTVNKPLANYSLFSHNNPNWTPSSAVENSSEKLPFECPPNFGQPPPSFIPVPQAPPVKDHAGPVQAYTSERPTHLGSSPYVPASPMSMTRPEDSRGVAPVPPQIPSQIQPQIPPQIRPNWSNEERIAYTNNFGGGSGAGNGFFGDSRWSFAQLQRTDNRNSVIGPSTSQQQIQHQQQSFRNFENYHSQHANATQQAPMNLSAMEANMENAAFRRNLGSWGMTSGFGGEASSTGQSALEKLIQEQQKRAGSEGNN